MKKIMTIEEMRNAYPSEWLLITDPQTDQQHQLQKGTVEYHSKDRDDLYRHAILLKPKKFATLYTGSLQKDTAVIL